MASNLSMPSTADLTLAWASLSSILRLKTSSLARTRAALMATVRPLSCDRHDSRADAYASTCAGLGVQDFELRLRFRT
jgi:hypothetical protein